MPDLPRRARHDPLICGAPGLFRSLARGTRARPLKLEYWHGLERATFSSPVLLGCDDLRVLQAVMALATVADIAIEATTKNASARVLRSNLRLAGDAKADPVLLVETSFARLAAVAGYGSERGGAMIKHLRASLGRLAGCTVRIEADGDTSGWRLLAFDELEAGRNRLRIALNPRSSRCATGKDRYTLIDMHEARGLGEDAARLCHQRLSTWIDASPKRRAEDQLKSEQKRVRLATLADYAWASGSPEPSAAALRQRQAALRAALDQLRRVGWLVAKTDVGADVYAIERRLGPAA